MKNQKELSPRVKYEEVAYFVTSIQRKDEPFKISRLENDVLRKLIHVESENKAINYSNRILAIFMDMTVRQVENTMSNLKKKGYINCFYHYVTVDGQTQKRRTTFINWPFIESLFDQIPKKVFNLEEDNKLDTIQGHAENKVDQKIAIKEVFENIRSNPIDMKEPISNQPEQIQVLEAAKPVDNTLLSSILDILMEVVQEHEFIDEPFINKIIANYENYISKGILDRKSFNKKTTKLSIGNLIQSEMNRQKSKSYEYSN